MCVYFVGVSIGDNFNGTVEIGSPDSDAGFCITAESFRVGVARSDRQNKKQIYQGKHSYLEIR